MKMQELYSEKDIEQVSSQLKKRYLLMGCCMAVLLALFIWSGRNHTETMEFKEAESEIFVVEGVPCRSLIFLGAPDKHGTREQRFYWDRELPVPPFTPGEQVTLKYTGRTIIGYEQLQS